MQLALRTSNFQCLEKWIKFKDYSSDAGKQLKIDFDQKAAEDCLASGFDNFDILEKVFKINIEKVY